MIELNQTSGNNNQTIWVLKLYGEGSEAITLGDFSASTGWTTGGDWAISGGVANYTYVDDSSGTLSRSVTVGTGSYIFSYEVLEKSGTGFSLKIDSSSGIVASDIDLDLGYGKHSYSIQCNGGSTFKLTASGFGADDYLVIDNVSLKAADNTTYISTRDIELNYTYDGKVLNKTSPFSNVVWSSTIQGSGGAGAVTSYSLSISRHIGNSNLDGFFNEFYPATGGAQLTSKIIDLGIVWEGASGDNEITWLLRGRIIEYSYSQRTLTLTVFQESEIINKEIPYYSIQKDFDNDVSYYTRAPEDNYGLPIPIVYGSFDQVFTDTDALETGLYKLAPCLSIDKAGFEFIIASHSCYETSQDIVASGNAEWVFKYINGLQSYLWIKNSNTSYSTTSNVIISTFELITTRGGYLKGHLFARLGEYSEMTDVDDYANVIDQDTTTYSEVDGGDKLALRTFGSASTSEIGILSLSDTEIVVSFRASTDGGGNRNYTINYYNNSLSVPAGDSSPTTGTLTSATSSMKSHQFGENTDGKRDDVLPWTIEEICGLDYYIENTQVSASDRIRVYGGYLSLLGIRVYAIGSGSRSSRRNQGRNL